MAEVTARFNKKRETAKAAKGADLVPVPSALRRDAASTASERAAPVGTPGGDAPLFT
jgi:hypothetical protein